MKQYEVYWRTFLLGILTMTERHHKYELSDIVSDVARNVLLDSRFTKPYDGEPLSFFEAYVESIGETGLSDYHDDQYRLKEI